MKKLIGIGIFVAIAFVGIAFIQMYISNTNREVDLRTGIEAQQKKCKTHFDNMWKILKEKAGVTDQYKQTFEDIFPKLIAGRYTGNGDGSLMKWVTESNPTFDASMYKDLMQSISIERTGFINEQDLLIDKSREHTALLHKIPSKWFLSDIKEIPIQVISSSRTDEAYTTGQENDFELFDKKDKEKDAAEEKPTEEEKVSKGSKEKVSKTNKDK